MRLKRYMNEGKEMLKVFNEIEEECGEYLEESGGVCIFRAENNNKDFYDKNVRKKRNPLTTPLEWHIELDKRFKKKFGWGMRSEAVFAGANLPEISTYGNIYYFFPVDGYKYIYSKKISDLTVQLVEDGKIRIKSFTSAEMLEDPRTEENQRYLDKLVKDNYVNKGLKRLLNSRIKVLNQCEIGFKCERYYMLNWKLDSENSYSKYYDYWEMKERVLGR